jgi:hypothetical protein
MADRLWHHGPSPLVGLVDFLWMCVDRHGQKLMDRRRHTQVVEETALRRRSSVPADVH